jgi:hypothetical protein
MLELCRTNAGRDIFIPSVTFGNVLKGRLASLSRTFQTDFRASVKRSDGFKKPVRRKFQDTAIALVSLMDESTLQFIQKLGLRLHRFLIVVSFCAPIMAVRLQEPSLGIIGQIQFQVA